FESLHFLSPRKLTEAEQRMSDALLILMTVEKDGRPILCVCVCVCACVCMSLHIYGCVDQLHSHLHDTSLSPTSLKSSVTEPFHHTHDTIVCMCICTRA